MELYWSNYIGMIWNNFSQDFGLSSVRAGAVYTRNQDIIAALRNIAPFYGISTYIQVFFLCFINPCETSQLAVPEVLSLFNIFTPGVRKFDNSLCKGGIFSQRSLHQGYNYLRA